MALLALAFLAAAAVPSIGDAAKASKYDYDEAISAQYIWLAQVTGSPSDQIQNWTCGLACETVKNIHSARVTQHGFPFQTLAAIASYGSDECIVTFRGSKTLLNYLLDDFNFVWTQPYPSCKDCKVHKGFYDSWMSLKTQILKELSDLGCDNEPIRVTGHSLGAAMSAIAAFELADNYTIKHVYTYGQPRVSNQAWVNAFETKMAQIPYFRVVDYMDAVPHLPPKGFVSKEDPDAPDSFGYRHPGPEVFYNATKMGSYRICQSGEDASCSDRFSLPECLLHTCCHCSYLGLNPCDPNTAKPQCVQPSASDTSVNNFPDRHVVV